jgi:hypothetical protein
MFDTVRTSDLIQECVDWLSGCGICIGNGLLCNLEFIFSSIWAVMSVRMYWMRQCVSCGDRRVVDLETNLRGPHFLRLVSSLCSSRPSVPVGKCTTPNYHIWLPALYAGLNEPFICSSLMSWKWRLSGNIIEFSIYYHTQVFCTDVEHWIINCIIGYSLW